MAVERSRNPANEPRPLPSDMDTEQAVLGAIMLNNGLLSKVADILDADCFHEQLHRQIYEIVMGLIEQGKPATPLTVKNYLPMDQDLGGITVRQYLARMAADAAATPGEIRGYSAILSDLRNRRQMIGIAQDMLATAYDSPAHLPSKAMIDGFMEQLGAITTTSGEASEYRSFSHASHLAVVRAQDAYQREGRLVGLSTGLPRLDEALGGLQNTDLIIIAGRPGTGKTALATNISFAVARGLAMQRAEGLRTGVVGFVSLEMGADQLAGRILSEQSGVAGWKLRRGIATEAEMMRYAEAERELRALPLEIDPTGDISIATLKLRARALKKRKGLALLIVDYLQLLKGSQKGKEFNRAQEVTEITTGLKALAKELDVPIIALSQLSRRVEERDDKRPMLSDLRESGSIEQDADVVMFLYRDEYYARKMKAPTPGTDAAWRHECRLIQGKGVAEVMIAKNRHGPEATVELGFSGDVTKFLNEPEPREELPPRPEREASDERPKPLRLAKEATTALGLLRGLHISAAIDNDGTLENIPRNVKSVPYTLWREKCVEQLLDPGSDDKAAGRLMEKIVKELKGADLIGRGGSKDQPLAWLTDKGKG